MSFEIVTIGNNDDKFSNKVPKVQFEKDKLYRFSFISWPGVEDNSHNNIQISGESPYFVASNRIFVDKVGFVKVPKGKEREYSRFSRDGQDPKTHLATIVVQWPVNREGKVDMGRLKDDSSVLILPLSIDKYNAIKACSDFAFDSNDIKASCTDTKFQKVQFSGTPNSILKSLATSEKPELIALYNRLVQSAKDIWANHLPSYMGKEMTVQELLEKVNGGGSAPATSATPNRGSVVNDASAFDSSINDLLD
jgi:hypothetical protein